MKRSYLLGLVLLLTTGVSAAAGKNPPEDAHADGNPLLVDAATQKRLGIVTAPVQPQTLSEELRAPGEVRANAYATILVSARVPAQVVRRHAKLGDTVAAGEPLVTLSSVEVAEAQGHLIGAEREWQRVRQLGTEAVSVRRYSEAQVARDQANAKLRAYGVGDGEIAALRRQGSSRANGDFSLGAPQPGRVTTDDFLIGERVEPGKPLFTLVDERTVWIEAQLASDAADRVQVGASTRVVAHDATLTGKVIQLSHRTQEQSRTTPVRIEVANETDALHPGEFVETFIATRATTQALAVPNDAIVQLQGQTIVFKAEADGHFEPAPIESGETLGAHTVVRQGLSAGDVVVVQGAYVLKARLLKSQLGEGHAH
jgi:membrane fusion protein, heavy metal efflux system